MPCFGDEGKKHTAAAALILLICVGIEPKKQGNCLIIKKNVPF